MKKIQAAAQCVSDMEKISKALILFGYVVAFTLFFIGAVMLVYYAEYIGDFSTGNYWFGELCHAAADAFGAVLIPVLIFENLYIITGLKRRS